MKAGYLLTEDFCAIPPRLTDIAGSEIGAARTVPNLVRVAPSKASESISNKAVRRIAILSAILVVIYPNHHCSVASRTGCKTYCRLADITYCPTNLFTHMLQKIGNLILQLYSSLRADDVVAAEDVYAGKPDSNNREQDDCD